MRNLRPLFLALTLLGVCFAPAGPTTHAERQPATAADTYLQWENIEQAATERTYIAQGATILTIDEYIAGDDENGGYFADWYGEASIVSMHGRAIDGVIILRPTIAGCWSLRMVSGDTTIEDWRSALPCAGRVYLPTVVTYDAD